MKHFYLLIATLLLMPVGAKAQFAWYGSEGKARIETGLELEDAVLKNEWYSFNDNADGGKSKIVWDIETDEINDNLVKKCGGLSGTAVLDLGKLYYAPFIGVGFNVAGADPITHQQFTADATAWNGIAISYASEQQVAIELGLGDYVDRQLGYDNPSVYLKAAPEGTFVRIPWSQFKQAGWGMGKIEIADAVAGLAAVKFTIHGSQYQTKPVSYHFRINAIGSYDMPEPKPTGDVNSDGSIDVADIATVIDVMAGKANAFKDRADVNNDGNVDVADIATIIDKMAGKG